MTINTQMGNICCCGKRKKTKFVTWKSPETQRRKTEEDELLDFMDTLPAYGKDYGKGLELKPIIKY